MRTQALTAVLLLGISSPALAGFEWIPAVETDRQPLTRAENVYDNSRAADDFGMNLPALDPVPDGMHKGELVINPFPIAANFAAGTDPFTSNNDNVERAMMEETGMLSPVALGGGLSTGVKQPASVPMAVEARKSIFAIDPYPSQPRVSRVESQPLSPAPVQIAHANMPSVSSSEMTPMIGGEVAPLPGYDHLGTSPRKSEPVVNVPSSYVPSPVMPMRQERADAPATGVYTDAVGFGKDLPLALALSQVIPPQYALSFGTGVDAGKSVSWEGGKPWNQVLQDMLSPMGLKAAITGNTVNITSL